MEIEKRIISSADKAHSYGCGTLPGDVEQRKIGTRFEHHA
jgi:hypothetical protein